MKVKPQLDQILEDFRAQCAVLEKEAQQASLTAADAQLVTSVINAALALVQGLWEYQKQTDKLPPAVSNPLKTAIAALHAIRVKPTISRAAEVAKRMSQAKRGKF